MARRWPPPLPIERGFRHATPGDDEEAGRREIASISAPRVLVRVRPLLGRAPHFADGVDIKLHPERSLTLLRCGSTARVIVAPVHLPVAVRVLPDPVTFTSAKPALVKIDAMRPLAALISASAR